MSSVYDDVNKEARAAWLIERPSEPREDADYSPPPDPYTSCAGGNCWHLGRTPCPEVTW